MGSWKFEPESFTDKSEKTKEHKPCGHWHKGDISRYKTVDTEGWQQSVDVYKNNVVFGAFSDTGIDTVFLYQYNLATDSWYWSYTDESLSEVPYTPGTVRTVEDFIGFYFFDKDQDEYLLYYSNNNGDTVFKNYIFNDVTGLTFWPDDEAYKLLDVSENGTVCCLGNAYVSGGGNYYIVLRCSVDYGATWKDSVSIGPDGYADKGYRIQIDVDNNIWACGLVDGIDLNIFKSIDGGITFPLWGKFTLPATTSYIDMVINDSYVYILSGEYKLYRSLKTTISFSLVYNSSGVEYFKKLIGYGDTLWVQGDFGSSNCKIYRSIDNGVTWVEKIDIHNHPVFVPGYTEFGRINNYQDKLVYADCDSYMIGENGEKVLAFLYSPDGGDSWQVRGSLVSTDNTTGLTKLIDAGNIHGSYDWNFTKSAWKH